MKCILSFFPSSFVVTMIMDYSGENSILIFQYNLCAVELYSEKPSGSRCESDVGLTATVRRTLLKWQPVSDRFLTVRFRSRLTSITTVQGYAPTETSDSVETNCIALPFLIHFSSTELAVRSN